MEALDVSLQFDLVLILAGILSLIFISYFQQPQLLTPISCSVFIVITVSVVCLLLVTRGNPLALPSIQWDGGNYLALARKLLLTHSHSQIRNEHFALSWGGELSTYPWGMSASIAGVSGLFALSLTRAAAIVLMITLLCISCVMFDALRLSLRNAYNYWIAVLTTGSSLLILTPLIAYNHWAQIVGMLFVLVTPIVRASSCANKLPLTCLIIVGVGFVYPLYLMPLVGALLLLAILDTEKPRLMTMSLLSLAGGLGGSFVFSTMNSQVVRGLYLDGASVMSSSLAVGVGVCCMSLALYLLRVRREVPHVVLEYSVLVALFVGYALIWLCVAKTSYVSKKLVLSTLLFALPLFAHTYERYLTTAQSKITVLTLSALFLIIHVNHYLTLYGSAYSTEHEKLVDCFREHLPLKKAYVVGTRDEIGWIEANLLPEKLHLPDDYISIVRDFRRYFEKDMSTWVRDNSHRNDVVLVLNGYGYLGVKKIFPDLLTTHKLCETDSGTVYGS